MKPTRPGPARFILHPFLSRPLMEHASAPARLSSAEISLLTWAGLIAGACMSGICLRVSGCSSQQTELLLLVRADLHPCANDI